MNFNAAEGNAAYHTRKLAYTLNDAMSGKEIEYQRAVLRKLLEQPVL
jgi:hypothetical protein